MGILLDDYLDAQGVREEVVTRAMKEIFCDNLKAQLVAKGMTKTSLAKQLGTSRAGVNRLLDAQNDAITLRTIVRVSLAVGIEPRLSFE